MPAAGPSRSASAMGIAGALGVGVELGHRRVAHAALGRVDDAAEAHAVVGVGQDPQVRQGILDLAAVVELHAAEDLVRDARADELLLDDAALGVGPVEDGHVAEAHPALVGEPADLAGDEAGLVDLVVAQPGGDELAADAVGPQVLGPAGAVVGDDGVGGVEDHLRRPVVLLEHHDRRLGERLLEAQEVAEVGAAEAVDRLVDVADHHDVAALLGQQAHELPLGDVRVLELVDEHVHEAGPPPGQHVGVVAQQLDGPHEEVVEVEGRGVLQALLVLGVDLGDLLLDRPDGRGGVRLGVEELVLRPR